MKKHRMSPYAKIKILINAWIHNTVRGLYSHDKREEDLTLEFQDALVTAQQKHRDRLVTDLLAAYVESYKTKVKQGKRSRFFILTTCLLVIVFAIVVLSWLSYYVLCVNSIMDISELIAFVTVCISFISLIIGLLTIITKYFFPENDEQYITKIVEVIQNNDLENKRENAKNSPINNFIEE